MLLEFAVENFRSIRDEQRLSLVASVDDQFEDTHVVETPDGERVLRAAAIYGPNASGKSNLLYALVAMRALVLRSARRSWGDVLEEAEPFGLDTSSRDRPTTFEAVFLSGEVRYQYGFSITRHHVAAEWLYSFPKRRSRALFARERVGDEETYEFGETLTGPKKVYQEATRPNALFLSTAVQLNSEALTPVYDWFARTLTYADPSRAYPGLGVRTGLGTLRHCESEAGQSRVVELLKAADVGIEGMIVETVEADDVNLPPPLREGATPERIERFRRSRARTTVRFRHQGAADDTELFDLSAESLGTQRLFSLAGQLLDVLEDGHVLVADELGASLHPLILRSIVELFVDPETNPSGAQLVFATHDTNLLDQELLRRDQFWFTEKARDGATELYPLTDFKPRKGVEPLEKNYLRGRYGALPIPRLPRAAGTS